MCEQQNFLISSDCIDKIQEIKNINQKILDNAKIFDDIINTLKQEYKKNKFITLCENYKKTIIFMYDKLEKTNYDLSFTISYYDYIELQHDLSNVEKHYFMLNYGKDGIVHLLNGFIYNFLVELKFKFENSLDFKNFVVK